MSPLQMLYQFKEGCASAVLGEPGSCPPSTNTFLRDLEKELLKPTLAGCETARFDRVLERLREASHPNSRQTIDRRDIFALLSEFYRVDHAMRIYYAKLERVGQVKKETEQSIAAEEELHG